MHDSQQPTSYSLLSLKLPPPPCAVHTGIPTTVYKKSLAHKNKWSGANGNPAHHQGRPSAMPTTQTEGQCHQVPRLWDKVKAGCHQALRLPQKMEWRTLEPASAKCHTCHTKSMLDVTKCPVCQTEWVASPGNKSAPEHA